ncbi:MAG: hypothetical protein ACM3PY_09790 [Omnitrophica WOR_2 bacterium]
MNLIRNTMRTWLALAAAITAICGLIYLAVQQNFRMGANDPQIQIAEDAAYRLANGESAASLVPAQSVDIARSLSPYLIIYDRDGKPIASNALLHSQVPQLPAGVLDYTRQAGEDRISWQPEPGVRSAAVIVAIQGSSGGFVLAGRSLREVENRENNLTLIIGLGWAVTLLGTLALTILIEAFLFRQE